MEWWRRLHAAGPGTPTSSPAPAHQHDSPMLKCPACATPISSPAATTRLHCVASSCCEPATASVLQECVSGKALTGHRATYSGAPLLDGAVTDEPLTSDHRLRQHSKLLRMMGGMSLTLPGDCSHSSPTTHAPLGLKLLALPTEADPAPRQSLERTTSLPSPTPSQLPHTPTSTAAAKGHARQHDAEWVDLLLNQVRCGLVRSSSRETARGERGVHVLSVWGVWYGAGTHV